MEKQFLLDNEIVSKSSNDNSVILTNLRILKKLDVSGKGYFISMHLQNISTIEVHSKSSPLLILFSIICLIGGLAMSADQNKAEMAITGVGLALLFILWYFFTRYHVVTVTSNGATKLNFRTKGMKKETVFGFVREIDQAKNLVTTKREL